MPMQRSAALTLLATFIAWTTGCLAAVTAMAAFGAIPPRVFWFGLLLPAIITVVAGVQTVAELRHSRRKGTHLLLLWALGVAYIVLQLTNSARGRGADDVAGPLTVGLALWLVAAVAVSRFVTANK